MTNWTHKLGLTDLHSKYQKDEITVIELGKGVAERLRKLCTRNILPIPESLLEEAEDIACEFEDLPEDIEEYDMVLERLYDWADTVLPHPENTPFSAIPKVCWINTF